MDCRSDTTTIASSPLAEGGGVDSFELFGLRVGYKIFGIKGGNKCPHSKNFKGGTNLGDVFQAILTKIKKIFLIKFVSFYFNSNMLSC